MLLVRDADRISTVLIVISEPQRCRIREHDQDPASCSTTFKPQIHRQRTVTLSRHRNEQAKPCYLLGRALPRSDAAEGTRMPRVGDMNVQSPTTFAVTPKD